MSYTFKIDLKEVLKQYKYVSAGLGQKTDKPILRTVLMETNGDELILRSYNRMLAVRTKSPLKEKEGDDIKFCVDPFFFDILATFDPNEDTIVERVGDTQQFKVTNGSREYEFNTIPAKDFPEEMVIQGWENVNIETIRQYFRLANIGISKEDARPTLQCFQINLDDGHIVTADGRQLVLLEDIELPGETGLPRARFIMGIDGIFDDFATTPDEVEGVFGAKAKGMGGNWTAFRNSKYQVFFSQYEGDLDGIINVFYSAREAETAATMTIDKSDLRRVLEICQLYESRASLDTTSNFTMLTLNGGVNAIFEMSIADLSNMHEEIPVTKQEGSVVIKFRATSMLEMVSTLPEDVSELCFRFTGDTEPIAVTSPQLPGFEYLQTASQG